MAPDIPAMKGILSPDRTSLCVKGKGKISAGIHA
jgi:hypothetical protein